MARRCAGAGETNRKGRDEVEAGGSQNSKVLKHRGRRDKGMWMDSREKKRVSYRELVEMTGRGPVSEVSMEKVVVEALITRLATPRLCGPPMRGLSWLSWLGWLVACGVWSASCDMVSYAASRRHTLGERV